MSELLDTINRGFLSNLADRLDTELTSAAPRPVRGVKLCQCCGELAADCRVDRELSTPRQLAAGLNPPRRIEDSTAALVRRTNRLFDGRTREEIRAAIPEIIKALQALWGDNEDQRIPEYDNL